MHGTKSTCIIKNIISLSVILGLIDDFKSRTYAICIDESTDISIQNHLRILVRYFSGKRNEIITASLGLIPVQKATGENVFNYIEKEFQFHVT